MTTARSAALVFVTTFALIMVNVGYVHTSARPAVSGVLLLATFLTGAGLTGFTSREVLRVYMESQPDDEVES